MQVAIKVDVDLHSVVQVLGCKRVVRDTEENKELQREN
jgi:hypothetical protein